MSACDGIQPRLSEYMDRQLDRIQADQVQAHLSVCDTCRGVADDLDRLRGLASSLGPITPPAHI
ncbi:MAG: zf-HC2 domain-containing protein [Acidobacteria bacterium]|jgi:predicted anti-sigma-YlaC factor YlaD|nr:zf-HC2 domain-containing protein [Acidobacteriota bacterium]